MVKNGNSKIQPIITTEKTKQKGEEIKQESQGLKYKQLVETQYSTIANAAF